MKNLRAPLTATQESSPAAERAALVRINTVLEDVLMCVGAAAKPKQLGVFVEALLTTDSHNERE